MVQPLPSCKCGVVDKCSCKIVDLMVDLISQNRLVQFLMGLDQYYDLDKISDLGLGFLTNRTQGVCDGNLGGEAKGHPC